MLLNIKVLKAHFVLDLLQNLLFKKSAPHNYTMVKVLENILEALEESRFIKRGIKARNAKDFYNLLLYYSLNSLLPFPVLSTFINITYKGR